MTWRRNIWQACSDAIRWRCTLALVAQQLGMHERALQRKLKAQAILFDELLDGLRQQRAREYLSLSPLPLRQVAFLSGYSG